MTTDVRPAPSAPIPPLTPTPPEERIHTLDVLRGFALFGVLWSNLNDWYGATAPATRLDSALRSAQSTLISGRFYTLLGLLFGIGFSLQLLRSQSLDRNVVPAYSRRLLVLLAIGWIHGLFIWRGDILVTYAMLGFALLLYRDLSARGLLIAAFLTFSVVPLLRSAVLAHYHLTPVPGITWPIAADVYARGTFSEALRMHVRDYWDAFSGILLSAFPNFLALFVIGLWLGRTGHVRRLSENPQLIRKLLLVALVASVCGLYVHRHFDAWWPGPSSNALSLREYLRRIPRDETNLIVDQLPIWAMTAAYACAIILLMHRRGWSRRLGPLAQVGRMALTTYLTQSIVCTLLFYGYGLRWFGRVGFTGMLGIAVVLFSFQTLFSVWWLRRYRFGPVEWMWRTLSYGAAQPMLRDSRDRASGRSHQLGAGLPGARTPSDVR